jgi:hypothetical protein
MAWLSCPPRVLCDAKPDYEERMLLVPAVLLSCGCMCDTCVRSCEKLVGGRGYGADTI